MSIILFNIFHILKHEISVNKPSAINIELVSILWHQENISRVL